MTESDAFLRRWPLFIALGAYWATVGVLVALSLEGNQQQLIYPLDDTYIHMAMAKNVAGHQVWGVTRYAFSSSTSSPLWTALLAAVYAIVGVNVIGPLIVNIVFGTVILGITYSRLRPQIHSPWRIAGVLFAIVFAVPLPALSIAGMEHVLHALLSLCALILAVQNLSTSSPRTRDAVCLVLLAPVLTMARYEGLFMIAVVCLLLFVNRRAALGTFVGLAALAPVVFYGLWSMSHGWSFLPNSLLLKGGIHDLTFSAVGTALYSAAVKLFYFPHLLVLVIMCLTLFAIASRKRDPDRLRHRTPALILIGTLFLHIIFASVGWFYRYEAYLVLLGIVVVASSAGDAVRFLREQYGFDRSRKLVVAVALMIVAIPFGERALHSLRDTPPAMHDRFVEHVQVARFIRHYYSDATVVLNDIGAAAFYTDAKILDMYGLGSREPIAFRRGAAGYTKEDVMVWTKDQHADVAILQIEWAEVYPRIPDEWRMVGLWHFQREVVFGDTSVAAFGLTNEGCSQLRANLKKDEPDLPAGVRLSLK